MSEEVKKLSWLAKLFRKKVKLTYWLGSDAYTQEICDFSEKSENCIVFKNYYTKNSTVVKYDHPIIYILEQVK